MKIHTKYVHLCVNSHNAFRGNELDVTLWGSYVEQFNEFLTSTVDHGKVIAVIQLVLMKLWDSKF